MFKMNAKKSWIIFAAYAAWLAGVVFTFGKGSASVDADLQTGLIWFGVSLVVAVGGIFTAIKLNKAK
jgi:hypothetical protein